MTMNGAVLPVLAFYIVAAEEQGVVNLIHDMIIILVISNHNLIIVMTIKGSDETDWHYSK